MAKKNIYEQKTERVMTMPNKIGNFYKISEARNDLYYQNNKTNEGVDIFLNEDIKEYRVKNTKNGISNIMIYAGKNQFDALLKAKNYMKNN